MNLNSAALMVANEICEKLNLIIGYVTGAPASYHSLCFYGAKSHGV